jgi:hypothetical protein
MMGLFFAWAVGEGIITWRWVKAKAPPAPGALLLPTALYLSLAILAEYRPARGVATAFAWAVNLAILMQVVGKDPAVATGWPPPKLLPTVIWPGGIATTAATGAPAKQSQAAKALNASNLSATIIKDIEQLPGFGLIK